MDTKYIYPHAIVIGSSKSPSQWRFKRVGEVFPEATRQWLRRCNQCENKFDVNFGWDYQFK